VKDATPIPPVPYDWLKKIPSSLAQMDDVPLWGSSPSFPYKEFSSKFSNLFQINHLNIQSEAPQWRTPENLLEGMSDHVIPIHFAVSKVEGEACVLINQQDVDHLINLLLTQGTSPLALSDPGIKKGFIHFLALETAQIINQINFDQTLNPQILEKVDLPSENSVCIDLSIELKERTFWTRLVLSPQFQRSWKERYSVRSNKLAIPSPLAQKLEVIVSLEAGKTQMTLTEWKQIALGDFLILDSCTYMPDEEKGRVLLTIEGTSLFRAKLKAGSLKILEQPLYHEVETTMSKFPEDEDEHLQDDLEFDESSGFDDLDDDFTDLESEIEQSSEEEHLEEEEKEQATPTMAEEAEEKEGEASSAPSESTKIPESKKPLSPEEIPMTIVVEVARLQMPIQKLMELQPGNILELDVTPENGVDLVVNGNKIAKGELLRVGDALGVRILEIG
jgi:flagellar motor switch protein FliN